MLNRFAQILHSPDGTAILLSILKKDDARNSFIESVQCFKEALDDGETNEVDFLEAVFNELKEVGDSDLLYEHGLLVGSGGNRRGGFDAALTSEADAQLIKELMEPVRLTQLMLNTLGRVIQTKDDENSEQAEG